MRESVGQKRVRADAIVAALQAAYPHSTCALHHRTPFQLLVATMLSAQTTDLKVNEATQVLFARYPDPPTMAAAAVEDVGAIINGIGLWRNKAKNAVATAQALSEQGFNDDIPRDVAALVALPGVGRKTATAVLGTAYNIAAGITVDTHMLRINKLLRLVVGKAALDPEKMAQQLERLIPADAWSSYTHRIIDHGRLVCVARRPRCGVCVLGENGLCPSAKDPKAGYKPANDDKEPASAKGLSWLG